MTSASTEATADALARPAPAKSFYIPSLDGLRAVAVMIVFFSHAGPLARVVPGGFGVTIFFFLSGFLITTLLRMEAEKTGGVSFREFYLRRVLRIFPPMYLALAFAVACTASVGVAFSGRVVALQAVHFTNYEVALGWTGLPLGTRVLWSLSVEEHFYLLFPLCYVLVRRAFPRPERQALVFLCACGALLAWRFFAVTVLHVSAEYTTHATDARIDSILFGCVLALWKNPAMPGPQLPPRVVWASFVVALCVLVPTLLARGHVFRETLRYTLQGLALAPVFIAAIRFPNAMPFRLLNVPVVRWIGLISYSLYLVHVVIIDALRVRLHGGEMQLTAIALVLSIGLSAAIYHTIERPCAKLRKKLSRIPSGA